MYTDKVKNIFHQFKSPVIYRHPVTGKEYRKTIKDLEDEVMKKVLKIFVQIDKRLKNRK